jgi:hypothetical protein
MLCLLLIAPGMGSVARSRTFVVFPTLLRIAPKRAAFLANIDIVNRLVPQRYKMTAKRNKSRIIDEKRVGVSGRKGFEGRW